MVNAALERAHRVQRRTRRLPARVVVYLLLAAALFPRLGHGLIWRKLGTATGRTCARISEAALFQARRRLGPLPLIVLFDLVRTPAAYPRLPGTRWRGLLVCATDGTTLTMPDSPANRSRYPKTRAPATDCPATPTWHWSHWWPAALGHSSTRPWGPCGRERKPWPRTWPGRCARACSSWPTAAWTPPT